MESANATAYYAIKLPTDTGIIKTLRPFYISYT